MKRHRLCTCGAEPQPATRARPAALGDGESWRGEVFVHAPDCLWTRTFGNPAMLAIASGLKAAYA